MRSLLSSTVLCLLCACQSYVAVPVQPVTLVAVSQRAKVKVTTKADVLLVVDDSLSMSGKQQRLAAALRSFTDELDALRPPVEYQVAVTTTSVGERLGACGPAGNPNAAAQCNSDWGATGFACDEGLACLRAFPSAGRLFKAPGAPSAILRRRDLSADQFAALLSAQVKVGVDGSRQPQGMEAMKLALADSSSGLLRDGAKVVVAFFTDAEDCSDPAHRFSALVLDPATGNIVDMCAKESAGRGTGPSLEPVASYVNFLRGLKNADGSAKEIEVGSIVSLADGTRDPGVCSNPACDAECDSPAGKSRCEARCALAPTYQICLADCASECHLFCGGQTPGRRYLELAYAFEGAVANVCSEDASPALSRLTAVIGIPKLVQLKARPQTPDLLDVRVERGGVSMSCPAGVGHELVETTDGTAVHFIGPCVLLPDDVWDVRYLTTR